MSRDPRPASGRHLGRPFVALGLILVVALGCDANPPPASTASSPSPSAPAPSSAPSASPSGSPVASTPADLARIYDQINAQVQQIRGLTERTPVEPTILSPEQMGELLKKQFATDSPPAELDAYERLYHALGVLPKDQKLVDTFVDLLSSQVGGLYVPSDKKLYVVSKAGGVGPLEKFLYSHEYTHALQDQNFDLQAFQPATLSDQTDRQLARQALVEGDAYVTMTYWLQQDGVPGDFEAVIKGADDPAAKEALKRIPPLVASQILFAALEGTVWVLGVQARGGYEAVNAAFANPPESTEQILHPDKWASHEPPIDVKLPADLATRMGAGWTVGLQDTFGEHQLGVWISAAVPTAGLPEPPPEAAVGWGGDRVALLDGPNGSWGVALKTEWDSVKDAAEFEAAIASRVKEAGGPGRVIPGQGGAVRRVVIGSAGATAAPPA